VVDERGVTLAADDDVVEHPDAEHVGAFPQATGDLSVLLRRSAWPRG
jgi:hypothetical protein